MSADDRKIDPHERLTPEELKRYWQLGDFTATGYLFHLVRALRKDGWWLQIKNVSQFCQDWGLDRRAFYRAKAQLLLNSRIQEHADNLFLRVLNWSEENCDTNVTPETAVSQLPEEKCDMDVTPETFTSQLEGKNCDTNVTPETAVSQLPEEKCDMDVTGCDPNVTGCDKFVTVTPFKPLQGEDSSDPSTLYNSIQIKSIRSDRVAAADAEATGAIEQGGSLNSEPAPEVAPSQPIPDQKTASELPTGSEGVNVPPAGEKKKRKKQRGETSATPQQYPEEFAQAFKRYCNICDRYGASEGCPRRASRKWDELIRSGKSVDDMAGRGLDAFEAACAFKAGKNGGACAGIPHFENYLTGSKNHETPYWQTSLDWQARQQEKRSTGRATGRATGQSAGLHWSETGAWQEPKNDLGDDISLITVLWGELGLSWDDDRVRVWMMNAQNMHPFPAGQAISRLPDWVVRKFAHDLRLSK